MLAFIHFWRSVFVLDLQGDFDVFGRCLVVVVVRRRCGVVVVRRCCDAVTPLVVVGRRRGVWERARSMVGVRERARRRAFVDGGGIFSRVSSQTAVCVYT
jgi:hypothetical protein